MEPSEAGGNGCGEEADEELGGGAKRSSSSWSSQSANMLRERLYDMGPDGRSLWSCTERYVSLKDSSRASSSDAGGTGLSHSFRYSR